MKKNKEILAFLSIIPIILLTGVLWPKLAILGPFSLNSVESKYSDYRGSELKKQEIIAKNYNLKVNDWFSRKIEEEIKEEEDNSFDYFEAVASWYGPGFHGRKMANGRIFDMHDEKVVAHKNLAFGTKLEIVNPQNNNSIVVVVEDRGPYIPGRDFDLSLAGAERLDIVEKGVAKLKIRIIE